MLVSLAFSIGHDSEKLKEAMYFILRVEAMNKLEGMEFSMLSKYMEEHIKGTKIDQLNQSFQRESIDSPSAPGSSKRSRKKSITIIFKNVEQGIETSNIPPPPTAHIYSATSTGPYASCVGTYKTEVGYDFVSGEIRMIDVRKVFNCRLKESFPQWFQEPIHLHY